LRRYIVTVETAKHRFFSFIDMATAPDHGLVCIAMEDSYTFGILSSAIHTIWALAAGGRLGVGNDPRYNKSKCFDPFPFPLTDASQRRLIGQLGEQIDAHRKSALARDILVTNTGMYNVIAKLRSGEPLTEREREVHVIGACGLLRDLHDKLDAVVADAYGWRWPSPEIDILQGLVALHDERVRLESHGTIYWLRPEYQDVLGAVSHRQIELVDDAPPQTAIVAGVQMEWPSTVLDQIAGVKSSLAQQSGSVQELLTRFKGARRDLVIKHVEILALMGEIRASDDGRYHAAPTA
jgi:hypothetical protein